MHEISYKRELSVLGQTININALDNWGAKFEEYVEDLQASVAELKNATPQNEEERHNLFLLKKADCRYSGRMSTYQKETRYKS